MSALLNFLRLWCKIGGMRRSLWPHFLVLVFVASGTALAQEPGPDTLRIGDLSLSASVFRDVTSFTTTFNRSISKAQGLSYALGWTSTDQGNTTLDRNQKSRGASLTMEYGLRPWFHPFLKTEGLASSDAGTGYQNRTYRTSAQVGVRLTPLSNLSISPALGAISEEFHAAAGGPEAVKNNSGQSRSLGVILTPTSRFPLDGRFSETVESQGLLSTHEVSGLGSVSRTLFGRQSLRADLEGFRGKYSYPLGTADEEKHQRLSRLRLSYELLNLKRIQGKLSETHSEEAYDYSSPDPMLSSSSKNYLKKEDLLLGSLAYHPWRSLDLGCQMRRSKGKNDYPNQTINTQVLDSKSLEVRAQARPNAYSVLDFLQTFGLDSYDFPHPFNFNARDLGSGSTFFRASVQATNTTQLGMSLLVRQDHLVYVKAEMSANNRWIRSYQVTPRLSFTPLPGLLWTQSYILRADYNLYDFETSARNNNLLLRSAAFQDSLRLGATGREDCLLLFFGGQIQSQGPYLYEAASKRYGYYTSQENSRYSFGLQAVHVLFRNRLKLTPGYSYERRRNTEFLPDTSYTKLLPNELSRVIVQELSLGAEGRLWKQANYMFQATRSLRWGEASYWDVRALLDWRL